MKDIEIDGRYRHVNTGKEYYCAGPCRIRHPDTGVWLDGVEYYSRHDDDQTLYVRTVESFLASFVKVVS